MKLIKPSKKYEGSWKRALKEFKSEDVSGFWNYPCEPKNIDEYIKRCEKHSKGLSLEKPLVPASTYWLIDDGEFVAHINIRHKLNDNLKKRGGHIGYAVRSSKRKMGYGSKILELALPKAKRIGLNRVLITCDDINEGSWRIIENNGGKLEKKTMFKGVRTRRYWIDL